MSATDDSSTYDGNEGSEDWEEQEAAYGGEDWLPPDDGCPHCRHSRWPRELLTDDEIKQRYFRQLKRLQRELEATRNPAVRRLREAVLKHKIQQVEERWPTVYRRIPNSRTARRPANLPPTGGEVSALRP